MEDMFSPNLAMDNPRLGAASDQGGNLLVLNACLDYFLDGLSDGRRRSQLPLQSSINQSIRAWIAAICRHAQLLGGVYSCSMAVEYNSSAIIDSSTTDSARTSGFPGCCVSPGSEVSDRALRRGTSPSVVFRLSVLASNPTSSFSTCSASLLYVSTILGAPFCARCSSAELPSNISPLQPYFCFNS